MSNKQKKVIQIILASLLVFLLAFSMAETVYAFEEDDDGYIPEGEIINDDLIISHQSVVIDGIVNGDVIASANDVTANSIIEGNMLINAGTARINGFVSGSVAFAGQQLIINSTIDGTIYFAGAELILTEDAQINGNLLIAGFSVEALPGSIIGRDIQGTGYQAILGGTINGNVDMDLSALEIPGIIRGDIDLDVSAPTQQSPKPFWIALWSNFGDTDVVVDSIPAGIRVSPDATIGGTITYKSPMEQSDAILSEPAGGVIFERGHVTPSPGQAGGHKWFLGKLQEFLTLLVFGAIALWLMPNILKNASLKLHQKPLAATGLGIVTIIGGFSATLVSFIFILIMGILLSVVTLGGLAWTVFGLGFASLSLLFVIFILVLIYGSKLVAAFWGGGLILRLISPKNADSKIAAFLIGVVIYSLLRLIPGFSEIFGLVITIVGTGAIWLAIVAWKKRKKQIGSNESLMVSTE